LVRIWYMRISTISPTIVPRSILATALASSRVVPSLRTMNTWSGGVMPYSSVPTSCVGAA